MKVSVVIPTYFRPDDLAELFDSLLTQTIKPLEVIVIDDTPADMIEVVCEIYKVRFESVRSTLIYIRNPRERSIAIARNVGAEKAQGEIIIFLDSDVILYPDYIAKIMEVFRKYSNALGVQGWNVNAKKIRTHPLIKAIQTFFRLQHYVKDSCKFTEYPNMLTKTINCEYLHGSNFAVKRDILTEFKFDDTLKKYSYMEDLLFSHSVYQKFTTVLYITPNAKCIHKRSKEGRMEMAEKTPHLRQCRKYVLTKLFGVKGLFFYYWQTIGISIINLITKIWRLIKKN